MWSHVLSSNSLPFLTIYNFNEFTNDLIGHISWSDPYASGHDARPVARYIIGCLPRVTFELK